MLARKPPGTSKIPLNSNCGLPLASNSPHGETNVNCVHLPRQPTSSTARIKSRRGCPRTWE
eukprot:11198575-Lingulodinium_polyedra.AAC.1